jgi:hypothetical protein
MARSRAARMRCLIDTLRIEGGERVIDLGGSPWFWDGCPHPLRITVVNNEPWTLKQPSDWSGSIHEITCLEADACHLDMFPDMSFDIACANSLIEHVGDATRQAALAAEIRRLAPRYWVQTPSIWFPIEAHTDMPFWWFWPQSLRERTMRRWRRKAPGWARMIDETTVIPLRDMQAMFPDGEVYHERKFGFTKSYTLYRTGRAAEAAAAPLQVAPRREAGEAPTA